MFVWKVGAAAEPFDVNICPVDPSATAPKAPELLTCNWPVVPAGEDVPIDKSLIFGFVPSSAQAKTNLSPLSVEAKVTEVPLPDIY